MHCGREHTVRQGSSCREQQVQLRVAMRLAIVNLTSSLTRACHKAVPWPMLALTEVSQYLIHQVSMLLKSAIKSVNTLCHVSACSILGSQYRGKSPRRQMLFAVSCPASIQFAGRGATMRRNWPSFPMSVPCIARHHRMQRGSASVLPRDALNTRHVWGSRMRPNSSGSEICIDELLELVIDDQHQGTSSSTQHVGPGSLHMMLHDHSQQTRKVAANVTLCH